MTAERRQRESGSEEFRRTVGSKERRRLRAEQKGDVGTWSAFGHMGSVGWFVALPTVLGSLFGVWLDRRWPSPLNWTLTMLGVGLFTGCVFAAIWMNREKNRIIREREEWESEDPKPKGDRDDTGR
ncbi:AtpZ/AtpI family protein [Maridesulfovibrio sp. FT414]|uniref:AtpZ/AtpI family protein n=1 Tax=Maridesulfovibrio sp. FT414 TaxID=2979469 RepID=UPI003D803A75